MTPSAARVRLMNCTSPSEVKAPEKLMVAAGAVVERPARHTTVNRSEVKGRRVIATIVSYRLN